jgi:8-oxo-dGTP pyrophosphatase MutT (NUDIX family)
MNKKHLVIWEDKEYELSWIQPSDIPVDAVVTSVHGYCFKDESLLVIENQRGFELPGGHLEHGEDYEAAFKREVIEEACIHIANIELLGYIRVEPLVKNSLSKYPPVSYMSFCSSEVKSTEVYSPKFECVSRKYISPLDIRQEHHSWLDIYEPSLLAAVK